jgi:pimeloyl-ACP methyl ester carboxylesterase
VTDQRTVTTALARVNGVNIAYRVQGVGPPLVLVMGYRLSSAAWPGSFSESLARDFTVITPDNRGTGLSDKPVRGYAIANMARDICALLEELQIPRTHLLGYSMGGAIAQEFVRQFPERVSSLILCATTCGGPGATYAKPSVVQVLRDLDGLSPEQAARKIWKVTYSPGHLERHQTLAEDQMRREAALPTPLHAADLQFQALAEFDGSKALAKIRCPTLVLTGDLDELIPPQNSVMMARLIADAKLVILPGRGHRVLWEATQECINLITEFLASSHDGRVVIPHAEGSQGRVPTASGSLTSAIELFTTWPLVLATAGFESLTLVGRSIMVGSSSSFGDGKPIILVPRFLGSDLALAPLALWLSALGYRPVTAGLLVNLENSSGDRSLSQAIRDITRRLGRKAVLITHSTGMARALRMAEMHKELISDVVVFEAPCSPNIEGVRTHCVSSGWSVLHGMSELPRLLRGIGIELIEEPGLSAPGAAPDASTQITAEEERT